MGKLAEAKISKPLACELVDIRNGSVVFFGDARIGDSDISIELGFEQDHNVSVRQDPQVMARRIQDWLRQRGYAL